MVKSQRLVHQVGLNKSLPIFEYCEVTYPSENYVNLQEMGGEGEPPCLDYSAMSHNQKT